MDEWLYIFAVRLCERLHELDLAEQSWPMDDMEAERRLNDLLSRWEQLQEGQDA